MVERDRFEKQLGAGWRSAYRYACEGKVALVGICDKLASTLAKTLREDGGIPAFGEMAHVLTQGRSLDLMAAFVALDDLVERENGHRHTKIAAEVAKSLIVQLEAAGWGVGASELSSRFAEASCSALIERNYFAKVRQPLLAEGIFDSYEHVAGWQSRVEEVLRPQLSKIAVELEKRPDGKGLRAPNRLTKKERTGDLLAENLLDVEPPNPSTGGRPR